jgi:hypothetical protein
MSKFIIEIRDGIGDERYVNVCCEQLNYKPVLLNSLL